MFQKGLGERAVATAWRAIGRSFLWRRGKANQHATAGHCRRGKATGQCCRAFARNAAGQRVVTARIQQGDGSFVRARHHTQHQFRVDCFEQQCCFAFQFGIDGDQIIPPVHLHTMSGIEKQGHICIGSCVGKLSNLGPHGGVVEIVAAIDGETEFLQRGGNVRRVVGRVWQRIDVGVGAVANHQCDTGSRPG